MEVPIVTISTGKIKGKSSTSINNRAFYSFQGIPYAKPPVGALRFKAPVPAESWNDTRDATAEGPDCYQFNPILKSIRGSEDCLTLNVYTPTISKHGGRPVMVWIHGGGFTSGSGSTEAYGPEFLLTEDIVLVTINYRVGIFGFLSLDDPSLDVPGNAGLKDIVLALKWVQSNITHFGGNPKNVTLFGESAGGAATHYLILSPLAKGLFHKAIMQSGCALNVWARGRRIAKEVAKVLNLGTTDERKILEVLQKLPVAEVYQASMKLSDKLLASMNRPHGPVVEKQAPGAFISEEPIEIIRSGQYNHIPMIVGYNSREGMLSELFANYEVPNLSNNFELFVPNFLKLQRGSEISKLVGKQIKEYYFGEGDISVKNKEKLYLLDTDNLFVREILTTVINHKKTSSTPIFLYRMSIETSLNMLKHMAGITVPGVCHGDELGYLFKNALTPEIPSGSEEEHAMKTFVKIWTNFAKYGKPNLEDIFWKPVRDGEINFLDIDKTLTIGTNPEAERMAFWRHILRTNPIHKL